MNPEEKKQFGILVKEYSDQFGREINSWELKKLWEKYISKTTEFSQR
jgi:hypothetical protein